MAAQDSGAAAALQPLRLLSICRTAVRRGVDWIPDNNPSPNGSTSRKSRVFT
jgi:hypothetical protein